MAFPNTLSKSMVLDGIAASEAIDSSGEILDVKGLDITSLQDGTGVLNYEHRGDQSEGASANDIIGHISFAKKIFGPDDCDNERQLGYWNKVQLPFVYIQAELFNDEGHPGAVATASLIRYYESRKLPILMRYSIEGSTLDRDGNKLKRAIAKRVAATIKPCNRSCVSGVLSDGEVAQEVSKDNLSELKRSETRMAGAFRSSYMGVFQPVIQDPLAKMRDAIEGIREINDMQKAFSAGGFNAAPTTLTGGSAMQVENFGEGDKHKKFIKNQALAALRDWRGKGDLRKFLKHRLPDTSPDFLDHFARLVEDYQLKKFAELEDSLFKAVTGQIAQAKPSDSLEGVKAKEHKKIPASKAKTLSSVEAHHAKIKAAHSDDVEDLPEEKLGDAPLTIRGRAIKANENVTSPHFDERKGILHTPRGSFKMYLPQQDKQPGALESFHNALNDPKASQFHDYAVSNWLKVHKLLKAGKLPPEVIMHSVLFSQMSPNCLDAETEALTQRGWIKGFDLRKTDMILTKNANNGQLEWQLPTDLKLFPDYEGPMVEFKSRSFYALTTPNHEWLVTTVRGNDRIKKSTEITFDSDKIHRTGEYLGSSTGGLTPDEAEVLGWFVTDGFYHRSEAYKTGARVENSSRSCYETAGIYACLCQSTTGNADKCSRIDALLERIGTESTSVVDKDGKKTWRLGPQLTKMLLERSPERCLTVRSLLDLSKPSLLRLREAMVLGDGHVWKQGNWSGKECLVTGRQEQAEAFQVLLTMTGNASSVVWRNMSKYEPKSEKMKNVPQMTGCYVVTVLQRKHVLVASQHRTDIEKMKVGVWCPILPNHFFVARRQGHVFITKNTPVPMQELMYSHLVDSMNHTGIDPRDPKFGSAEQKADWVNRDKADALPIHSEGHFVGNQGVHLKNDAKKGTTGRKAGDTSSFMLANNKFNNVAQYHGLHDSLVDLFNRHGTDARGAVGELMAHKHKAGLWDAQRQRTIDKGHADPGEYNGPNVPGLAPKTGRYMAAMAGGGNVHVPDTHFTRYLFGAEKGTDARTIAYLKNTLWNTNNSHVLDGIDRFYAQNHPAVQHMMDHPVYGKQFENREDAIFPAFWKNWMAIAPHERARGMKTMAYNEATDHRPFWEAISPYMKSELPMDKSGSLTLPSQTAQLHAKWVKEFGEIPAQMLYYAHIVPQLLRASRRSEDMIVKMERIASELQKAASLQPQVSLPPIPEPNKAGLHEFGDKHVKPGEIELVSGPYKGSKLAYLGKDAKSGKHFAKSPEGEMHTLPFSQEGRAFKINAQPTPVKLPMFVDANKHADPKMNKTFSQNSLVHGIDMNNKLGSIGNSFTAREKDTGWYKNYAGRIGLVKPDILEPWMWDQQNPDADPAYTNAQKSYSLADREVLYPTMAKDFFGMGHYFPETAKFRHPQTGHQMSVQEKIPGAEHADMDDDEHTQALHRMHQTGELDKLGLMDMVMGNNDRNRGNFMMTKQQPNVRMIDNGLSLDHKAPLNMNQLWNTHHEMTKDQTGVENAGDHPLHPASTGWLMGLDKNKFEQKLAEGGVPPEMIHHASKRLLAMQLAATEAKLAESRGEYSPMRRSTMGSVVDGLNGYTNRWDNIGRAASASGKKTKDGE